MDCYNINNLNHHERDKLYNLLQDKINENRLETINNANKLTKLKENNSFLTGVYEDYDRYRSNIIKLKQNEKIKIKLLIDYLENNLIEKDITENKVRQAKHQQNILLGKLHNVQNDLDIILNNSELIKKQSEDIKELL